MGIHGLCAFVPLCLCNLGRLVLWAFCTVSLGRILLGGAYLPCVSTFQLYLFHVRLLATCDRRDLRALAFVWGEFALMARTFSLGICPCVFPLA